MSVVWSTVKKKEYNTQNETKYFYCALGVRHVIAANRGIPTRDFDFLDCLVALVLDVDFDWDCFTVIIKLRLKPGEDQLMEGSVWISRIT